MNEIWKPVVDYEGLYEISNLGEIRSLFRYKKTLNQVLTKGYLIVSLFKDKKQKTTRVHRIVAKAFVLNPDNKPQINHINGIKTDNKPENLEWCTTKENTQHAHRIGLCKTGCNSKRAKLNKKQISEIRSTYNPNVISLNFLAKKFNVSKKAILLIIQNKTYKNE
jgi:hypothetical protein